MEASNPQHYQYLQLALAEAQKCEPVPTAFCVGCILVAQAAESNERIVISSGYSRELAGNTHAEANALTKFHAIPPSELAVRFPALVSPNLSSHEQILMQTDVYTTMEPCSIRTSGLPPCANALVAAKVKRCFIGTGEPEDFVHCEGAQKLEKAGIEVVWLKDMEEECLKVARRAH
jgi:pyrimidine deaminase RibD-like protein